MLWVQRESDEFCCFFLRHSEDECKKDEEWMMLIVFCLFLLFLFVFLFLVSGGDGHYVMLLNDYVYIYNIYKLKIIPIMQ